MLWFNIIFLRLTFLQVPWYFAVISDTQANPWVAQKAYQQMLQINKIQNFLIYPIKIDLVIHLGDLYTCASKYQWRKFEQKTVKIPTKYVIGNHELISCRSYKYLPYKYRKIWREYHQKLTYSNFYHKNWTFILMDNATPGIRHSQLKWITNLIKQNKRIFIFGHRGIPCRNCDKSHKFMDPMPHKWLNIKFKRILTHFRNRIRGTFHGHYHGFRYYRADGIPTWCSGGGGGYLARGHGYHWLLIMVWGDLFRVYKINIQRKEF